jgi:hypothetical protein
MASDHRHAQPPAGRVHVLRDPPRQIPARAIDRQRQPQARRRRRRQVDDLRRLAGEADPADTLEIGLACEVVGAGAGGEGLSVARSRTAAPGPIRPSFGTVTRIRRGNCCGPNPSIRIGAISSRAPDAPGLATSTTQPSTAAICIAGTTGDAARIVPSLAANTPHAANATSAAMIGRLRCRPQREAAIARPTVSAAVTANGHSSGSNLRPK